MDVAVLRARGGSGFNIWVQTRRSFGQPENGGMDAEERLRSEQVYMDWSRTAWTLDNAKMAAV